MIATRVSEETNSFLRRRLRNLLGASFWSLAALCAHADVAPFPAVAPDSPPRAVGPAINAYYRNADVERWQGIFERPGREVFDRRFEVLHAMRIEPGTSVADVGAGTGFYTLLFARAVGSAGKVYAVDISKTFAAEIERRATANGLDNIQTIVNDQRDTHLPVGSVDLVFICDTYHHFEYPRAMLGSIARALKDDGVLVLIDFRREKGTSSPWVMGHVRANRAQVTREVIDAGFELTEELNLMRENYFLRFRKVSPVEAGD